MSVTTIEHTHEFYWYPATNENGWKCWFCGHQPGEPPGFDPKLDRDNLRMKVDGILRELHEAEIVYVSSGEHGEHIVGLVENICREDAAYDQYSIARTILDTLTESHAAYWREIGEGVTSGKDPRHRCACGKLSTVSTSTKDGWLRYCGECRPAEIF